ncbi:RNA pyrophosphohydrolase [Thalassospira xiamenensis]|uniref:RNA pyrophosphohydrolase n=1 Tax=Thalassospira xiamenensis TaxID=220697 RepID=UPI000DEDC4E1|nr:RNA pyrophosphohydrolase [Thalassospira xiamenensis]RCK31551.1 RNA pyrophosphohydrolase [Thalassospira xiamenensis]
MAKKSGSKSKKAAKPDKDQPIGSTGGAGLTAEDLPYRPCVGIALFNDDGQVWIGNRIGFEGAWQLPQGGIDDGETAEQAARRELSEEIGTDKAEIIAETPDWLTYDLPDHLIGKAFGGKYRGQKQKWFAMRFTGKEKHIKIDVPHPEFDAWRWTDFGTLPDLIVPFKRPVYLQLVEIFRDVPQRIRNSGTA